MTRPHTTIDIARAVGVHPSTVRLYESLGYLPPVPRDRRNGYRRFDERHLAHMRLAWTALGTQWWHPAKPLLRSVVTNAVAGSMDAAVAECDRYLALLDREVDAAMRAVAVLDRWASGKIDGTPPRAGRRRRRPRFAGAHRPLIVAERGSAHPPRARTVVEGLVQCKLPCCPSPQMRATFPPEVRMRTLAAILIAAVRTAAVAAIVLIALSACSEPLPWPDAPLYDFADTRGDDNQPDTLEAAMRAIEGRYARFDVVSYEDLTTRTPMRTLVISYGFTEYRIEGGRLVQVDRFCHAEQKINQEAVEVVFTDEATRAIEPRSQEVELRVEDGRWHLYRPASPTLLGIDGDPSKPLSTDPDDPNLTDPDGDGHPGVTVLLSMGGWFSGELYITRREIYENHLVLQPDGSLRGYVVDDSEQFVIGASRGILRQQSNPVQLRDPGMNPIVLVPIDDGVHDCDDLTAVRDDLFPPAPSFH